MPCPYTLLRPPPTRFVAFGRAGTGAGPSKGINTIRRIPMRVFTYDTTLRDGTQGENVSLSVDDKLAIARKLDELGIDYIEGGWPGSNPRDKEFFDRAKSLDLKHSRLAAFGSLWSPLRPRSSRSSARAGISIPNGPWA